MAKKSFEENMARLEEIVALLEKGDAQLSQSLSLFEEGTKLAAACRTEFGPQTPPMMLDGVGQGRAAGGAADEGPRRRAHRK